MCLAVVEVQTGLIFKSITVIKGLSYILGWS